MKKKKRIVIALGGNALGNTLPEQMKAVKITSRAIVDLIEEGCEVVVAHGNGPQVGIINNAMAALQKEDPNQGPTPLSVCGAMSQAYIGYDLQNALREELLNRGVCNMPVCSIVTQVEVDPADPAFQNPSKPIGKFMTKSEAADYAAKTGYLVKEDAGRGWRRAVASPQPKRVVELESIRTLLDGGSVAQQLDADCLIILTAVEKVAINYRTENERWLSSMTPDEARTYIAQGQFAPGSMLPKVQAAVQFAESKEGRTALITLLEKAKDGVAGRTGTAIHC